MNALEKQVLRLIGESVTSPDVFTDIQPIRDSISDAIQEIVMLTGGYHDRFTIPLVKDKTFYRLSLHNGDLGWIESAWLSNIQVPLEQTDFIMLNHHDPRWMQRSSRPVEYFMIGTEVVGFTPKPASSSDVVELDCVVIPAPYTTDKARLKVRDAYRYATVNYALSEYYASRGDAPKAEQHLELYGNVLGERLGYVPARERVVTATSGKVQTHQTEVSP